jgi:hypothetical protein
MRGCNTFGLLNEPKMNKAKGFSLVIALLMAALTQAQVCNINGNVVIYTNYDGGVININCDANIPNLKIGITTYENAEINITGPFAANVTEVLYAGYQGDNDNCGSGVTETTINGVGPGIATILFAPAGVLNDPEGYPSIICAYSCGPEWQGGCNTSEQVVAYFLNEFGGTLRTYQTQYNCWQGETYNVSDSECCSIPTPQVEAYFSVSDPIVCIGQCIQFTDLSSQNPDSWTWSFDGANISSSTSQDPGDICFLTPGNQQITLTAANDDGSDSYTTFVQVISCGTPGCTYSEANNYNPAATVDDSSCIFPVCSNSCPGDLDEDGIVSVSDLIAFIALYGSPCPQ